MNIKKLKEEYHDGFNGLGCFEKEFRINLKENAIACAKPEHRIPIALKEPLRAELNRLCQRDIIEKCWQTGSWISNIVIVEKPNKKLRICINPKELNNAIQDNFYEIPSFEDIKPKLHNKKLFSVFDMKDGFWQIALDDASKELCTFSTTFGCYRLSDFPLALRLRQKHFKCLMKKILEI